LLHREPKFSFFLQSYHAFQYTVSLSASSTSLMTCWNKPPEVHSNIYFLLLMKFVHFWYIKPKLPKQEKKKFNRKSLVNCTMVIIQITGIRKRELLFLTTKSIGRGLYIFHARLKNIRYEVNFTHLTYNFSTTSIETP